MGLERLLVTAGAPARPDPRALRRPAGRREDVLGRGLPPIRPGDLHAQQTVLGLQRSAGNRAVTIAIQRAGGWPDADPTGPAWNDAKAKAVAKVWRIAIAGLAGGASSPFKGGDSEHTTEAADHRAIVLVPQTFNPKDPVRVMVYFHGHTETWRGQYAGFRQRTFKATAATRKAGLVSDNKVRDVALDQMEDQISAAGKTQLIGILAQGGPQHQFGDINVDAYIKDVLTRTNADYPTVVPAVPTTWSVILAGHSGGGTAVKGALSDANKPANLAAIILFDAESMAGDISRRVSEDLAFLVDTTRKDPDRDSYLAGRPAVRMIARDRHRYGKMYGTLVPDTIAAFLRPLLSAGQARELAALRKRQTCPALSTTERARMVELTRKRTKSAAERTELAALRARFDCRPLNATEVRRLDGLAHRADQAQIVARYTAKLLAHYQTTLLDPSTVEHEEIIRGTSAGSGAYQQGQGNLERALTSL